MLISRGINLLKTASRFNQTKNSPVNLTLTRLGHQARYRTYGHPDKSWVIASEVFSGFAWWWVLWHLWHEYEHITGEWEYPDMSKLTDAELGIPPDNED